MVRILRREHLKTLAVEADAVQVRLVRVFIFLASTGRKVDTPIRVIHILDLLNHPVPLRDLVLKLSCSAVKVKVIPTVSFRAPEELTRSFDELIESLAGIYVGARLLPGQDFLFSRCSVNHTQFFRLVSPLVIVVEETLAVGKPLKAGAVLERQLDRGGLYIDALSGLNIEDDRLRLGQHL